MSNLKNKFKSFTDFFSRYFVSENYKIVGHIIIWIIILIITLLVVYNFDFIELFDLEFFKYVFNESIFKDYLIMIISASIAMLSIVFSLSQFILQSIASNISERVKSEFQNNHLVILFYLIEILLILVCFVGLCLKIINFNFLDECIWIITAILFILSIIYLIKYSRLMFCYFDQKEYIKLSFDNVNSIESFENENNIIKLENLVVIGDISIKSIKSNEDFIYKSIMGEFKNSVNSLFEKNELSSEKIILTGILIELYRIFKKTVELKDLESSKEILYVFKVISSKIIYSKKYEFLPIVYGNGSLKAFFGNEENIFKSNMYFIEFNFNAFFNSSINESIDLMKFFSQLILSFCDVWIIVAENFENKNFTNDKTKDVTFKLVDLDWHRIFSNVIFQSLRIVIDIDNFEVFKMICDDFKRKNLFSPVLMRNDILSLSFNEIISNYGDKLFEEYTKDIVNQKSDSIDIMGKINNVESWFDTVMNDSFKNFTDLMNIYNNPFGLSFEDISELLNDYLVNALVYKQFFALGAYSIYFFDYNYENEKSNKYIKEIWYSLDYGKTSVNVIPSHLNDFDELWLFNLYLFAGNGKGWGDDYILSNFFDFHSYLDLYFILSFVNSTPYENYGASYHYVVLDGIINSKDSLFKTLDQFEKDFDNYSELINDKLSEKLKNYELKRINEINLISKTKQLIDSRFNELKVHYLKILNDLSLDSKREEELKTEILNSYCKYSDIFGLNSFKINFRNSTSPEYFSVKTTLFFDKNFLVKDSSLPIVFAMQNKDDYIKEFAIHEQNKILEKIQNFDIIPNKELGEIKEDKLNNLIKESIKSMRNNKLNPNLIILPKNLSFNKFIREKDHDIKVIYSDKIKEDSIYILDGKKIILNYIDLNENEYNKKIHMIFNEKNEFLGDNPHPFIKLDIISIIDLEVEDEKSIFLIKFGEIE
ncbi:MAG: hypothetical protein LBM96_05110 [Methanobrevibacter sp.]|nr:hypothetical protein [Candidatus Methanoflexus mossambicus]